MKCGNQWPFYLKISLKFQLSDSSSLSYGHSNNNKSSSRKVIIHRKPSISDSKEENNNNYTDMDAACSDLKNNNNSVTVYGENGSSSFQANVGPNGLYNMQPVQAKYKRFHSPPPFNQQYPQGRQKKSKLIWIKDKNCQKLSKKSLIVIHKSYKFV